MELSKVTKFEQLDFARWVALGNKVGGLSNVVGLLQGDLEVEVRQADKKRFDHTGRRIPPRDLEAAVRDPDRNFHLAQPLLDSNARLQGLADVGLVPGISAADFQQRTETLIARVREDETVANLLNGVHLPIVIPRTVITDLGQTTEEFVAVAEQSYRRQFLERSFTNYRAGELAKQVKIFEGSRYERLITALAAEPVIALYFPNPLQGFSVDAQREQMSSLPDDFILSGPLDIATGWIMYPDVLGRGFKTPVNDCSAVSWQSPLSSLCFCACDGHARFDARAFLACAFGRCSGGLGLPRVVGPWILEAWLWVWFFVLGLSSKKFCQFANRGDMHEASAYTPFLFHIFNIPAILPVKVGSCILVHESKSPKSEISSRVSESGRPHATARSVYEGF